MFEHYILDNPPQDPKDNHNVIHDPDYEEPPEEHYVDPDFDKEWDELQGAPMDGEEKWEEV